MNYKESQMNLTKSSTDYIIMVKAIILVAIVGFHKFIILICADVGVVEEICFKLIMSGEWDLFINIFFQLKLFKAVRYDASN